MGKKRRLQDVLSVEELRAYREEGLTNAEIGAKVGFSGKTVSAYVRNVCPDLAKRSSVRNNGARRPEPVKEGCVRCGNKEDYVDFNDGLCVQCKREMAHGAGFLDDPGRIKARVRATAALAKKRAAERVAAGVATRATSIDAAGGTSGGEFGDHRGGRGEPLPGEEMVTGDSSSPAEDDTSDGNVPAFRDVPADEVEALFVDHAAQELKRLELLARVKEAEKDAAYWCDRAVRLALKLADLQALHAAEMEQVAKQLEEVTSLLNRAQCLPLLERVGMTLVVEPAQLEEAVQAWTGERMLVIRDVTC